MKPEHTEPVAKFANLAASQMLRFTRQGLGRPQGCLLLKYKRVIPRQKAVTWWSPRILSLTSLSQLFPPWLSQSPSHPCLLTSLTISGSSQLWLLPLSPCCPSYSMAWASLFKVPQSHSNVSAIYCTFVWLSVCVASPRTCAGCMCNMCISNDFWCWVGGGK